MISDILIMAPWWPLLCAPRRKISGLGKGGIHGAALSDAAAIPGIGDFLDPGLGYFIGKEKFKGFSLGAVTGTLLAGVLIGQLNITISPNVKAVFFLDVPFCGGVWSRSPVLPGLKE